MKKALFLPAQSYYRIEFSTIILHHNAKKAARIIHLLGLQETL
jgi:hypothetical protein